MEAYESLEQALGEWVGNSNVVVCSSGTAALHLALETLRPPPRSLVFQPDYSMIAVPRATVMASLSPVFVDCTRDRLLMDLELLEDHLSKSFLEDYKGGVILAVHVYGRILDMERVHRIARRFGLLVVEDMAEAHDVLPHPHTNAACWSFYKNKVVAGEEGGCVAFKIDYHVPVAKSLRSLGFTPEHDYTHIPGGHNYRMSNLHAEVIERRLRALRGGPMVWPDWVSEGVMERRRRIEQCYERYCPLPWTQPNRRSPWVYDFRIPGLTREKQKKVVDLLRTEGYAARYGFKPMSYQREFSQENHIYPNRPNISTNADNASREVIYLPIDPGNFDVDRCLGVWEVVKRALGL